MVAILIQIESAVKVFLGFLGFFWGVGRGRMASYMRAPERKDSPDSEGQLVKNEVSFRKAEPDESEEIITLVAEVFHGSTKHYHALLHGDPLLDFDHIQVAVVDGRIVSTVWVIPREVRWCGGIMTVGGLGNVVTHPDYRGRGYATWLMEQAMAFMKRRGYPLALLRTEIPEYYCRLGWEAFPENRWEVPIDARLPPAEGDCSVRPFDVSRDLENVMSLYARFNENNNGSVVRSRSYWEAHFSWIGHEIEEDPNAFFVAETDKGISGYIRATQHGTVAELALDPSCEESLWTLLGALAEHGRVCGRKAIVLPILPCVKDREELRYLAKPRTTCELMLCPVDLDHLMSASQCHVPGADWLDLIRSNGFHYWMTDYF